MAVAIQDEEWEATCFFTGFNGPSDPRFCMVAMSADSSDPLTLNQAMTRPDWDQWLAAIQDEEWEATCFFTGFNGPSDPRFCMVAMSADSSDPLTLNQAMTRPDWDQLLSKRG